MRLTVIGCTGSFPGPVSPASCYMLTATDFAGRTWRIIMDMGNGSLGMLQRHIDLSDIDAILISHLHPDHCIDLSGLHVAVKWDPRGWPKGRIPLYGPAAINEYLSATHGLDPDPGMSTEFEYHTWTEGEPVQIGPFRVEPFRVVHPSKDPYALRITCNDREGHTVFSYSGDTDLCEDLVKAARGADLFLCEAAYQEGRDDALRGIHLTGKRAGQAATEAGVRNLLLTHLPVWNDPDIAREEARSAFSGPVGIAEMAASYRIYPRPTEANPVTSTLNVVEVLDPPLNTAIALPKPELD